MWRKHTKKNNAFIVGGKLFSALLASLLLVTSCSTEDDDRLNVDVSNIQVSMQINDITTMLSAKHTLESDAQRTLNELKTDFPDFAYTYTKFVLLAGDINDPMLPANFSAFLTSPLTQEALQAIQESSSLQNSLPDQLLQAFKYVRYYFPDAQIPAVYLAYNSFNYGVFPTENMLIIGCEMYLGEDHPLTAGLPFHEYIKKRMQPQHALVDAMRAWMEFNLVPPSKAIDFLGHLINEGKMMYLLEATMPKQPKHVVARYTPAEYSWCLSNELNIWKEIVDQNMLYSKDELLVTKFMNEAPFTAGLPKESPPRIGQWLGWMMIRDYMRKHPEVTIPQMLQEKDLQKILSAYRPDQERKN